MAGAETTPRTAPGRWRKFKYAVDPIVACLLLVLLGPLFGLVALLIKLDDGGPVFFRQQRVGLRGRPFWIWKFRTMIPNAHALSGGYFPSGMRIITRVGRVLRKTSIDEIPQLLNIAAGQMCFIGPRPTLPDQVARYTEEQLRRLEVKPGITGWAQLHGRNNLAWSQRICYDLEYIAREDLNFDLKILLRTIPAIFLSTGVQMNQTAADQIDDLAPQRSRGAEDPMITGNAGASDQEQSRISNLH